MFLRYTLLNNSSFIIYYCCFHLHFLLLLLAGCKFLFGQFLIVSQWPKCECCQPSRCINLCQLDSIPAGTQGIVAWWLLCGFLTGPSQKTQSIIHPSSCKKHYQAQPDAQRYHYVPPKFIFIGSCDFSEAESTDGMMESYHTHRTSKVFRTTVNIKLWFNLEKL